MAAGGEMPGWAGAAALPGLGWRPTMARCPVDLLCCGGDGQTPPHTNRSTVDRITPFDIFTIQDQPRLILKIEVQGDRR